jgi:hypothetical protein
MRTLVICLILAYLSTAASLTLHLVEKAACAPSVVLWRAE